jgi:hypothetical protein
MTWASRARSRACHAKQPVFLQRSPSQSSASPQSFRQRPGRGRNGSSLTSPVWVSSAQAQIAAYCSSSSGSKKSEKSALTWPS